MWRGWVDRCTQLCQVFVVTVTNRDRDRDRDRDCDCHGVCLAAYDPAKFTRLRQSLVTADVRDRLEKLLIMYVRLMLANVPEEDRARPAVGAVTNSAGKRQRDTGGQDAKSTCTRCALMCLVSCDPHVLVTSTMLWLCVGQGARAG